MVLEITVVVLLSSTTKNYNRSVLPDSRTKRLLPSPSILYDLSNKRNGMTNQSEQTVFPTQEITESNVSTMSQYRTDAVELQQKPHARRMSGRMVCPIILG
jgi:hypothetical protein